MKRRSVVAGLGVVLCAVAIGLLLNRPSPVMAFLERIPKRTQLQYTSGTEMLIGESSFDLTDGQRATLTNLLGEEHTARARKLKDGSEAIDFSHGRRRYTMYARRRNNAEGGADWRVVLVDSRTLSPLDKLDRWWRGVNHRPYP